MNLGTNGCVLEGGIGRDEGQHVRTLSSRILTLMERKMDTCTSLIMHETIVFLPFDGILMRNTSFRAKRASELRAMYEGAVCSLDAIERFGRAPVTFRQVSSFPRHRFAFSPTDREEK